MKLKQLIKGLALEVRGKEEVEITGLSSHSHLVSPGNLFIAKRGKRFDGNHFARAAVDAGAVAIVSDCYNPSLAPLTQLITSDLRALEGELAARYYETKEAPLFRIGVTGTNGKTTTVHLLAHLLPRCGLMGTVEVVIGERRLASSLTTSDLLTNHKHLRQMADAQLEYVAMEVTSHALDQGRVAQIPFDVGLFTNLSHDHLDYHVTMESYRAAKLKLAPLAKQLIYNREDLAFNGMGEGITFGLEKGADLRGYPLSFSLEGSTFEVEWKGRRTPFQSPLLGVHNLYNSLGAIAVALHAGRPLFELQERMRSFPGVPGRLERIPNSRGVALFVDFAHTPEALKSALFTLKQLKQGRLLTLFGCGGERDQSKRPLMGAIAEAHSDAVLLTSDNPRREDPMEIVRAIAAGFSKAPPLIELDRRRAIGKALEMAKRGDTLLIAGKGHEREQQVGGRVIPFSDRCVAEEWLSD